MRKVGRLLAAAVAVLIVLVAQATPAAARTNNRSKPVIYVHGYNPFGDGTDCNVWSTMDNRLRAWGLTGAKVTFRYHFADTNCTQAAESYGRNVHYYPGSTTFDRNVRLEHLGYRLAWMIYKRYSSRGITVDVVSHSMGGLITRYALTQIQRNHRDFPPYLYVEDSVTLGTPHAGVLWADSCGTTQCSQMRPGSSFLKWLATYGPNPQADRGTDWTAVGSYVDDSVSEGSAVSMGAVHKVQYLASAAVSHSDYLTDTSNARTADVRYSDKGGPWHQWLDAPWAVRWSDYALLYGSW